ncbi:sodium- and chloride-dependent GABA transporter 1-like [Pocillopora verrucosa]|uniref:sodium- and chloride-dependent GABA transporter 1-like n=1 Tax=Pocillopora verrucosa TaxID=203993 RepID=UPI00334095FC
MTNKVQPVVIEVGENSEASGQREKWTSKADFIASCIGYAVGLGNIWRFPYLCYKNGGATFLIPYFLTLITCGIPLFYLELALGQYLSLGTIKAWAVVCPALKGIGVAMVIISFLISIYYNVVISWSLLYLYHSFASVVPWKSCGNSWNTANCSEDFRNFTANCTTLNCSMTAVSPSQEFWERRILDVSNGIDEPGEIRLPLATTLFISWIAVFFCIHKGIKSSGKVAYFTAIFPYIVLCILLVRGVTLPGALDGIIFYLKPDVEKLLEPQVWIDAATQIFFSLSVGLGGLVTYASYNEFNNNCERDAVVVSCINCATSVGGGFVIFSVIGFMAHTLNREVAQVVSSGPGLGFVAYPEGIAQMPAAPVWAVMFFFMLFTIGLGSQFVFTETTIRAVMDTFVKLRPYKGRCLFCLCVISYLIGLSCVTKGGIYVLNIFDSQSGGFSLICVVVLEAVAVSWGYGVDKFSDNIKDMIGRKPSKYFVICWKYVTPLVATLIFLGSITQWKRITYNGYMYPDWAQAVAWLLALSSFLAIPIFALYTIFHPKGPFRERLRKAVSPNVTVLNSVAERHKLPNRPRKCPETRIDFADVDNFYNLPETEV